MDGTFGERVHPDLGEHVVGDAELVSGIHTAVLATQPLTVEQVRTGVLGPERSSAEAFDGLSILLFRRLAVADKRLATRKDAPAPVGFAPPGSVSEPLEGVGWPLRRCQSERPPRSTLGAPKQ